MGEYGCMEPKFIKHHPPRRYSKACVYGNFIFLAGEDSKDPVTEEVRRKTSAEQADYLFQNMVALRALNREIILRASDREVNAPEETHLEVVRHVAAVRPTPRRWIDVRAVI